FGGHVYAPTLTDMPTGHFWAYVGAIQAEQIVRRHGAVEALRGHYRGWSGLEEGFLQAAERELWQREGWRWFAYPKTGAMLTRDTASPEPQWAEVRIEFITPAGAGAYEARVEIEQQIETEHSSNDPHTLVYPQYRVTRLVPSYAPAK
ncbi:MAG TPA: hypothetical protein VHD90_03700, partial [Phototrophicaceae bacterium]|nr:hypothetical protein [Phototrophicaceae bacterium]